MSKTKLQIKNRMGEVLFVHEREYNTLGITLEEAVRQKADLSGADLRGADLRGADLSRANLWEIQCGIREIEEYGSERGEIIYFHLL